MKNKEKQSRIATKIHYFYGFGSYLDEKGYEWTAEKSSYGEYYVVIIHDEGFNLIALLNDFLLWGQTHLNR
jgi:hypothetical protein